MNEKYDEDEVVKFETRKLHSFKLPEITFETFENGVKLSIDIFKNGFVHHSTRSFNQPYTDESQMEILSNFQESNENDSEEIDESKENISEEIDSSESIDSKGEINDSNNESNTEDNE